MPGIEVIQITTDPQVPGSHLYMEAQVFTMDSKRFVLHRSATAHGGSKVDTPLPGTALRPRVLYPLSTISPDGKRMAISAFLGDGRTEGAPFGLMVLDLERPTVRLVLQGPAWCNMHPQYSRSTEPEAAHDILVQENHGNVVTARGAITQLVGGAGADIHVIRDDGTHLRDMPWGRDGNEQCQGQQCWRGRSARAITSTGSQKPPQAQLIEGRAAPHADHAGSRTPGGVRNDLTREFPNPHFYHFATDIAGRHLVSDAAPFDKGGKFYLAELSVPGQDPLRNFRYLLCPRSSCTKDAHIHPFLSPDGTMAFFNSDESGILQAYMIRGL